MSKKESQGVQVSLTIPQDLLQRLEASMKGKNHSELILDALKETTDRNDIKKLNGVVYTPSELAEYVASKAIEYLNLDKRSNEAISILDPACGDGELLFSIWNNLTSKYKSNTKMFGVDIDAEAVGVASKRLPTAFKGVVDNGLCPNSMPCDAGWDFLINKFKINSSGFDLIIANPPWGADVNGYKKLIEKSNFSLFTGQFDTSDLFIEMAVEQLNHNGVIAFIVPDSIFYQERDKLRELLIKNTKICFIGRFGEGIFSSVNRACSVIICKKSHVDRSHYVDCIRASGEYRKKIIKGTMSFLEAEQELLHKIKQSRFTNNKDYLFNIDIDDSLSTIYTKILNQQHTCRDYLSSCRGVELSKKGNVIRCSSCEDWTPLPKKEVYECKSCGAQNIILEENKDVIVHQHDVGSSRSLIVGESISRYSLRNDLWIELDRKGINYKKLEVYTGDKIVVRKTGVGISASIDYDACLTNQVVYMFKLNNDLCRFITLELLIMILNSRMAFFFVAMSNGEIEWKSHPYITQKQVLEIPIPDLSRLSKNIQGRVSEMSLNLSKILKGKGAITKDFDASIEMLVADIYGLSIEDYNSIFKAIDKSQELISVKALKMIGVKDIFKGRI
ncbi:N-6 DNA methylase [Aliivibrio sp. S10_S31]|uniref:N-6 DNA methylase n=1 Tax=Aliivibrio sp. S10_S31 TaxID=2720224 RepID=UPI001680E9AD|nr:N-6 DNA methylase [Aliivibrio sp. S10_S31]MBD1569211.1 N-6 DNA methylase [Aliivibrio sp. S10_S31]